MAIPIGQLALGCNLDWLIQTHGSVVITVNFPKWVKRFTNTGLGDTGIGNMHIDPVVSQHLPRGGGYAGLSHPARSPRRPTGPGPNTSTVYTGVEWIQKKKNFEMRMRGKNLLREWQ